MKKLLPLLFLLSFILFYPTNSEASHPAGGEVYWECNGDGSYTFYMHFYRDCTGIPYAFWNKTIDIVNSPLPRNANNQTVSSIVLYPDSAKTFNQGNIYSAPSCINGDATSLDCGSADVGAIEHFFFRSDSIILKGTPPNRGWIFSHVDACCRGTNSNLSYGGTKVLRSTLYWNPSTGSVDSCYESSARFAEFPRFNFCRDQISEMNFSAFDIDSDSLSYHWDSLLAPPYFNNSFQVIQYDRGYTYKNPLPNQFHDTNNVDVSLDSSTGLASFMTKSGIGINKYYLSIQANSWRKGQLISSVSREIKVHIRDCGNFSNQSQNLPPTIAPPISYGAGVFGYRDTVRAGQSVLVNLNVTDTNRFNNSFQNIEVFLKGAKLSKNLRNSTFCNSPLDNDCAVTLATPTYDSSKNEYVFRSVAIWSTQLIWQTDCNDLEDYRKPKTHCFHIIAKDDLCPLPGRSTAFFTVTVMPNPALCYSIATAVPEGLNPLSNLNIYPNPSSELVFIDGISQNLDYQIFNIQGKLMKRGRLDPNQNQLELPEAEGLYFVSFRDAEGNEKTYKLIKQ